mmetsp:Transcript_4425/g.6613  ORF Transcript_4425/g.6613 Transcript_4425/m.6613 type:complete len:83 (+) Transcript_4425:362-610(+)
MRTIIMFALPPSQMVEDVKYKKKMAHCVSFSKVSVRFCFDCAFKILLTNCFVKRFIAKKKENGTKRKIMFSVIYSWLEWKND